MLHWSACKCLSFGQYRRWDSLGACYHQRWRRGSGQQWPRWECQTLWSSVLHAQLLYQTSQLLSKPVWQCHRGGHDQFSLVTEEHKTNESVVAWCYYTKVKGQFLFDYAICYKCHKIHSKYKWQTASLDFKWYGCWSSTHLPQRGSILSDSCWGFVGPSLSSPQWKGHVCHSGKPQIACLLAQTDLESTKKGNNVFNWRIQLMLATYGANYELSQKNRESNIMTEGQVGR